MMDLLLALLYVVGITSWMLVITTRLIETRHKNRRQRPDYAMIRRLERELDFVPTVPDQIRAPSSAAVAGAQVQQWIGNEFVIPARAMLYHRVVIRDGHIYHRYEDGRLILIKAPPPDKEPA